MKRWLSLLAVLAAVGAALVQETGRGQVPPPIGPGDQGATLRQPGLDPAPTAPPSNPLRLFNQNTAPDPYGGMVPTQSKPTAPRFNRTDINRDIELTPTIGPWLILVMSYTGEEAPVQARKFVSVLKETYRLNAYVFNYGAEEKRQEYERAKAAADQQRAELTKAGLSAEVPIRVRVSHIPESTGVFIGSFRDRDEAQRVLEQTVRKLDPKDLAINGVALQIRYLGNESRDPGTAPKINVKEDAFSYKNPFTSALPVRNPCLKPEERTESTEEDVKFLRKVNADEPLSLFHCKKPFTLAIKQFKMAMAMKENGYAGKGFLDFMGKKKSVDYAASNAHNVAEAFRKAGLTETYVLHTRYSSYVTVGGYDSETDPNLIGMQNYLEGRFRMEAFRALDLMPRPIPMQVPH